MRNNNGFTLIEVLIALVILSIALTAIVRAASQNIKDSLYLQKKTIALWVANDVINQTRAGLLKLPAAPDSRKQDTSMLGETWSWRAWLGQTPNKRIQKIEVDVYQKTRLAHLTGYLYEQSQ
jgi:general secretion pathway protein I